MGFQCGQSEGGASGGRGYHRGGVPRRARGKEGGVERGAEKRHSAILCLSPYAAWYRRSGVCVVSLPTPPGAPTVPLWEDGVGTKLSLVCYRSFVMAGLLRLGGGGVGAPATGCHRGAVGEAWKGLGRAPLTVPLSAWSWSTSGQASWWTRGPRGRAPLGRCAQSWKGGPEVPLRSVVATHKNEQGTAAAHKWALQKPWNPNPGNTDLGRLQRGAPFLHPWTPLCAQLTLTPEL